MEGLHNVGFCKCVELAYGDSVTDGATQSRFLNKTIKHISIISSICTGDHEDTGEDVPISQLRYLKTTTATIQMENFPESFKYPGNLQNYHKLVQL